MKCLMRRSLVLLLVLAACSAAPVPPADDAGAACPELFLQLPVIDFGCVARGATAQVPFPDAGVRAGSFTSLEFKVEQGEVQFRPQEAREYAFSIPLFRGVCPIGVQPVIGTGVVSVLTWSPSTVDFGFVNPGVTRREVVTFSTCSTVPLVITDAGTFEGSNASMVFEVDGGELTLPAASRTDAGTLSTSSRSLEVSFSPTGVGSRTGQLRFATALTEQPQLSLTLRGVGGGPVASVMPTRLDFGQVTAPSTRLVTITNIGTQPTPADPRGNLFLGHDGNAPYFELAPASCGTATLGAYDPLVGLAAADTATISIELQPAAAARSCTLHVFTSDRENADVVVSITAP
jgi:hypothetical protein